MAKSLTLSSGGGREFERPEEGQYFAKCYLMADIGTQLIPAGRFNDKETMKRQLVLGFELLKDMDEDDVRREDGKTFILTRTFTASLHPKGNLRPFLESWRGKKFTDEEADNFDIAVLVGKSALLQVTHTKVGEATYANIGVVMNTKKQFEGDQEDTVFSVSDAEDAHNLDKLPQWVQEKVRSSKEWATAATTEVFPEAKESDDEIELDGDNLPF